MPGPDIRIVQYGDMQGVASLCINIHSLDLSDATCLVRHVAVNRLPGVGVVQLTGDVPWGTEELDKALLMLKSDARSESMDVWAMRPVHESKWAALPLWWCHDVSKLMDQPRTATHVIKLIQELPFLPAATEVIAIKPDPKVIDAAVLDEVHTRLDAGIGWLYVEDEHVALATREIAKAATHWGIRKL